MDFSTIQFFILSYFSITKILHSGCKSTRFLSPFAAGMFFLDVLFFLSEPLDKQFFSAQSQMADFEIRIFNRWGEQVFYSTDKNFQWDGNFKGKTYYNNVYQYVIRYSNLFGKSFVKKGTVTVL